MKKSPGFTNRRGIGPSEPEIPMRHPIPSLIFLFVFACSMPLSAAERLLQLTPENTQISFLLEATGHNVEGKLHLQDGQLRFDDETGQASGEIRIDARRADTGNKRRDKKMHDKVLESEKNPLILFEAKSVEGAVDDGELSLVGSVTLLGKTHPLTLPVQVERDGDRIQASASFSVPYVNWGLRDPSVLILRVAKEVQVTLEVNTTLTSPEP